jgi:hypothetical protein
MKPRGYVLPDAVRRSLVKNQMLMLAAWEQVEGQE